MTKEQALNAVEKAIDLAFDKGKELSIHSVIGCFKTLEECENESIKFTTEKMKIAGSMLSDDYKTGYKEGVEHYLQNSNNIPVAGKNRTD